MRDIKTLTQEEIQEFLTEAYKCDSSSVKSFTIKHIDYNFFDDVRVIVSSIRTTYNCRIVNKDVFNYTESAIIETEYEDTWILSQNSCTNDIYWQFDLEELHAIFSEFLIAKGFKKNRFMKE